MAYDISLADRVREEMADLTSIEEKEMMGGLVFMYNGKMCVGIIKDELMCRIDPAAHEEAVEKTGCRTMDFTKKPMRGYIFIDETGMKTRKELQSWIQMATDFNKNAKATKKTKK
jgi:TfoX/Sxy family transcriptional regulator of competence genes